MVFNNFNFNFNFIHLYCASIKLKFSNAHPFVLQASIVQKVDNAMHPDEITVQRINTSKTN